MLTSDDFDGFVGEVHSGWSPFPWQRSLLRRLVDDGRWPDVIDVPTGLGKTSALDVALFAAALGAGPSYRRVFYVVDRRLVVDEAFEHALRLSAALQDPEAGRVTRLVAQRLKVADADLTGDRVLDVTRMRGGVTWDRTWIDRPDRYAIVTGTVDQVGSRLLFRGYGVSERARSIDAALVGTDSLIIVDEAHLAEAFVQTATSALAVDAVSIGPRPTMVTMSATTNRHQIPNAPTVHQITVDDEVDPVAGQRLNAAKQMRLVEVKTTKAKAAQDVPAAMARLATHLAPGRIVGVVVNTVSRARAIHSRITDGHEAILLTGRSRQVDRDVLIATYYDRIKAGRQRSTPDSLIVVATQTVEVGANIDFDALITDSAPIASLVQRLGRLNRLGHHTATPAVALVVHDSSADIDDPIYGNARATTWQWMTELATPHRYTTGLEPLHGESIDASPAAMRKLLAAVEPGQADSMRGPRPYVPVVHRTIVDAWTRTAPAPEPDQPIEPFLHGVDAEPPPVTLVWRANLGAEFQKWGRLVDAVPPAAEEGLDVSASAVRHWLSAHADDTTNSDLDTQSRTVEQPEPTITLDTRCLLRYSRRGQHEPVTARQVRPGDTIIVPAEYGGCDQYGWNPTSHEPTLDVADAAQRRGRPLVRIGDALLKLVEHWDTGAAPYIHQLIGQATNDTAAQADQYVQTLRDLHDHLRRQTPPTTLLAVVDALLRPGLRATINQSDNDEGTPPLGGYRVVLSVRGGRYGDDDTTTGSSTAGHRMGLDGHQRAVAERARIFARNLNLPDRVVDSVVAAARWHDEGKRDPRFQVMLWNGDKAAALIADEPLAKSGMYPTDRATLRRARQAARYPRGMRHEALSARIAAARLLDNHGVDIQLVIHLIASHHGHARSLLPPIVDTDPVKVDLADLGMFDTDETIDWTQPTRFATLNNTYGRWGLSLLETIVRLADIWCSSRNEQADEELELSTRGTP